MRRLPLTLSLIVVTSATFATAAIAVPAGHGSVGCPLADDPVMAAMHAAMHGDEAMHAAAQHANCPMADGSPHVTMPHDGHPHHGGRMSPGDRRHHGELRHELGPPSGSSMGDPDRHHRGRR